METIRMAGIDLDLNVLTENINDRLRYIDIASIYRTRFCRGWMLERDTSTSLCNFLKSCAQASCVPCDKDDSRFEASLENITIRRRYSYNRLDVELNKDRGPANHEMNIRISISNIDSATRQTRNYRIPLYSRKPEINIA